METPEIGDIAHVKTSANSIHAGAYGIVGGLETRRSGEWTAAELLIDGQRCWVARDAIDQILKDRNPFAADPAGRRAPCRVFCILARDAAVGVIFRRGPTRWVQLIRWDTAADAFEPGQWFHGRLYERRADLSPDGGLLIYFAAKISGRTLKDQRYSYAWTAIGKPPYLTALALWPKRVTGTYFGGGLFEGDARVWLNHPACEADPHPSHLPARALEIVPGTADPRYEAGYYRRLQRDGWRIDEQWWQRYAPAGFVGAPRAWHEKRHPQLDCKLIMESSIFYSSEAPTYALQDDRLGVLIPIEGATWADWDQRGRLVYASGGKLFAAEPGASGLAEPTELADFNANRPAPLEAPAWATEW